MSGHQPCCANKAALFLARPEKVLSQLRGELSARHNFRTKLVCAHAAAHLITQLIAND
jgi:hypothetical protein